MAEQPESFMKSDLGNELSSLEKKLREDPSKISVEELRRIYELTGIFLQKTEGMSLVHNPCSLPGITEAVLEMSEAIKPCRLLNVGLGGYPLLDIQLVQRGFDVTGVEYAQSLAALSGKAAMLR